MDMKNLNDYILFSPKGLSKKILFNSPKVLCFVLSLSPGQSIPDHGHETSALTLTVLKGRGQARVNGRMVSMAVGTILYLDEQDTLAIPVVEEDFALLVTVSPNPEDRIYSQETDA